MKKLLSTIFLLLSVSCTESGTRIIPWTEYAHVYDQSGRTEFTIDANKHHYMLHTTLYNFNDCLAHTPKGKIDRIISANPSWQFIFYCHCQVSDTSQLINLLKKHDCKFPVIIDPEREFLTLNKIEKYTEIGFICHQNGKCQGISTIGTSQSFFDKEFQKAKGNK